MDFAKIILFASLLVAVLSILWLLLAALMEERIPNRLTTISDGYSYDYVVVGAGSAGCVVASLLAKHSNASVLLVEAGDAHFNFFSKIPLLTTFQQKGLNDWSFLSQPQIHSSKSLINQRQCLPRGKGLGGSSQLNYMLHYDGCPNDFERWASTFNLSGWRWQAFEPYMLAGKAKPYEQFNIPDSYSKITETLKHLQTEFMHKNWTYRTAQYNIKDGLRYSVFHRFLQPAFKYNNLRILTNAMAKKIVFNWTGTNELYAKYLEIGIKDENNRQEQIYRVGVERELIVCAGSYQTPQLLMLSGLGLHQLLQTLKLNTDFKKLPALPRVGKNLHDHLNVPLYVSINEIGPTINQRALLNPIALLKYLFLGSGPWGNFGVMGHIDNIQADLSDNYALTVFAVGAIDESTFMSISNFKQTDFRALFPLYHNKTQEGFVINSVCLQPLSRGSVNLQNSNIRKNPLIDPNYVDKIGDIYCGIKAIRTAIEIITSKSFASLNPRIHWPRLDGCKKFGPFERDFYSNKPSDKYLECLIRHVGLGSHHPGGTCAMGSNNSDSVVDHHFRIHGIRNVRIIDASVLPTPISGNPNSVIVGMAIRGVTWILKDYIRFSEN